MADPVDFSSFNPSEEKAFVPFERTMRANVKRAFTIGGGVAGGLFIIAAVVVLTGYTPCTRFCKSPPSTCSTDSQIAAFKANCETACRDLEHQSGLTILKEIKDEKTGKIVESHLAVSGEYFVDQLASCSFAGGSGSTCESVTKVAEARGLWCVKK